MRNRQPSLALRQSFWLSLCLTFAAGVRPSELAGQVPSRDDWQRVPDVVAALAISEGSQVADVGAGSGYFTERLASVVGANGRVLAVDISEAALSQLRRLVQDEGLTNVEIIQGELDDPKLPAGSLDAVLVVNTYHMMTERASMLAAMFRSLKPGGRLVMLDRDLTASTHAQRMETNQLNVDLAEQDLTEAGFVVLVRDPDFAVSHHNVRQWLLVARR